MTTAGSGGWKLTLLAILLLGAGGAMATLRAAEQAEEMPLRAVSLPPGDSGTLSLRRCASCRPETLRITRATRCFVRPAGAEVPLGELRQAAARVAARPAALLYLYYDPRTREITRLVLDPGP